MVKKPSFFVARILWVLPALLFVLTIHQIDVALDLHETLTRGTPAVAEVTEFRTTNRAEIKFDEIGLRATLPDGRVVEQAHMSIPHSFAQELAGRQTLDVRVLPGADQPLVIASLGRAHWRMAAINAAMSALGFVLLAFGVGAWNRYLRRRGDPAQQVPEAAGASPVAALG